MRMEKPATLRALKMLSCIMTKDLIGYLKPWTGSTDLSSAPSPTDHRENYYYPHNNLTGRGRCPSQSQLEINI